MGFNNHAQRYTPPYYLDVDNPIEIVLNVITEKKKILGGGEVKYYHDTNYHNKPMMFQVGLLLERSKSRTLNFKLHIINL